MTVSVSTEMPGRVLLRIHASDGATATQELTAGEAAQVQASIGRAVGVTVRAVALEPENLRGK